MIEIIVKTHPVPLLRNHLPLTGQVGQFISESGFKKTGRRKKKREVMTTEKPAKLVIKRLEKLAKTTKFKGFDFIFLKQLIKTIMMTEQ